MRRLRTIGLLLASAGLIVAGLFLPSDWLVDGATLVRALLIAEGVALGAVGALDLRFTPLAQSALLPPSRQSDVRTSPAAHLRGPWVLAALAAVAVVALGLRLVHLGDDLWLDEIVTVRQYASGSVREMFAALDAANNHLLNSLGVHLSIRVFGQTAWAIRLPALVWGVLTVPALYWAARQLFEPLLSFAAATLLAVSYQHVFFSQDSRGYTAYMLFGLASTTLLTRALREDRLELWAAYVAASLLCIASVPTGAFVVAGNALVACVAFVSTVRRGSPDTMRLLRRLLIVYGAIGALSAQLYAPVVTHAAGAAQGAWRSSASGFHPFSIGFARQLGQGFTGRVGPLLLLVAVPVALAGLAGSWSVVRRDWALAAGLTVGPLLNVAFVVVRGLAFAPRFLLFLAFPAILAAVETVRLVAGWVIRVAAKGDVTRRPRSLQAVQVLGIVLAAGVLAAPLVGYYRIEKQPYQAALARAATLRPSGVVIAADNMEQGVLYYGIEHPGTRKALAPGVDVFFVRSATALDSALTAAAGRTPVVLTTLDRALRTGRPLLYARIRAHWEPAARLSGSIGDGGITIWLPRDG